MSETGDTGDFIRKVAVKLIEGQTRRSGSTGPSSGSKASRSDVQAVVVEARALCRVEHPNVVRFHALETDSDDDVYGLVMEYLEGTPVNELVRAARSEAEAHRALPVDTTMRIGHAVASALAASHRVGVLHRDVKPANIVQTRAGEFKPVRSAHRRSRRFDRTSPGRSQASSTPCWRPTRRSDRRAPRQ